MTDKKTTTKILKTSLSQRCYSLVKASYFLFAFVFIYWFSSPDWFSQNLSFLGLPIIFLIIFLAHCLLRFLESKIGIRVFSFLFKGRPPVFYLEWLKLHGLSYSDDKDGAAYDTEIERAQPIGALSVGLKRFRLDLIDRLELTIWGNLVLRSSYGQGEIPEQELNTVGAYFEDVMFKLPFSAVDQETRLELVQVVKDANPQVVLNKRLEKRLESKIVKGEELVKALGAIFLAFVLLDLGYSTATFLEMQKHFYLSQAILKRDDILPGVKGIKARQKRSESELLLGEKSLNNPLPISLVQRALLDHGSAAGGVWQARGEALYALGKRREAIESLKKAHKLYPESLKLMIELARFQYHQGDTKGCRKILSEAIEKHSEEILPCLYMIAADKKEGRSREEVIELARGYLAGFDETVFGDQPNWPPGGDRFMSERFYRQDIIFLAQMLMELDLDNGE